MFVDLRRIRALLQVLHRGRGRARPVIPPGREHPLIHPAAIDQQILYLGTETPTLQWFQSYDQLSNDQIREQRDKHSLKTNLQNQFFEIKNSTTNINEEFVFKSTIFDKY